MRRGIGGINAKLANGHRSHISGTARSQRWVRDRIEVLLEINKDLIREFNGHKKKEKP